LAWLGAKRCSLTPPPQVDRGEKRQPKARGLRQGQGEIAHQLASWEKMTHLREMFNLLPIKIRVG